MYNYDIDSYTKFDFGPVGNTEKKWADFEQLLRSVFSCFQGQKIEYVLSLHNFGESIYYVEGQE